MDISLHTTIAGIAADAALFGLSTYAYPGAKRLSAELAPDREGVVIGLLFGLTAILAMLVPTALLPGSLADGGPIAVALAAPFGGFIAAVVAAVLAAAFHLWLSAASSLPGIAVIFAAALMGVLLTAALRRGGTVRYRRSVVALAFALPAAAYIGLALRWPITPGESAAPLALILGVGIFVSLGTLLFGAFLLHRLSIEEKLAESHRRVEALAANVPGVVFQCRVGSSGDILFSYLSPDCVDLFGVTPEDARKDSRSILRLIHPGDAEAFTRSLREAGGNLALWSHDFRILDGRGRIRWLHARATPRRLGDGEIAWHGALIEISRRKEREMAFRRVERLYRLLADNTTEIVQLTAPDGTRRYASPACHRTLGHDSEELIGQPADSLVHPEDAEIFRSARAQVAAEGKPCSVSYRIRRKDGAYVPATETCCLGELAGDGRGREIISVTRVSEQRGGDESVFGGAAGTPRAADAPFAKALEAIAAGVFITNPSERDNPIIFANAAAAEMTRYAMAELIGRPARILHGADSDRDTIAALDQAIAEGRRISVKMLTYRRDGTSFWSSLHISPIHSAAKRLQAFVAVFIDIGEHQGALSEALSRETAERAAGEFIADISHELRTPLNGAIGFTDLLLEGELSPEQRRYATFIRDAGRSLLAILNNSLERAKLRTGFKGAESEFSVAKLALGCNAAVWYAAREKGLDLNFVIKPDVIDAVRGYPDRVRQVLLGLLGDAIKSTEKGGIVLSVAKAGDAPDGTVLRFAVTDTGPGMALEKQRGLCEEAKSRGIGRGLSLCRALVDEMGGNIGANTPPNGGSEFWFTVPLGLAGGRAAQTAADAAVRKGRILLAEDAPMNQELILALLTRAGYEVEVVADGLAAIEAAKRRSFDLLLLDIQMPRLDGIKAAETIRALPEPLGRLPIIAITAKVLAKDVERCRAAGMNDHLAKPIDGAALLALVERWTGAPANGKRSAPAATAERPPSFNHAAFGRLETHLGVERAAEIADIVGKQIPERLERMLRQVSDRERLSREAQALVSLAGNLGFADLALQCCRLIEAPGEADDWQLGVMVENAKSAAERAIAAMRRNDRPQAGD